jgi:integrase
MTTDTLLKDFETNIIGTIRAVQEERDFRNPGDVYNSRLHDCEYVCDAFNPKAVGSADAKLAAGYRNALLTVGVTSREDYEAFMDRLARRAMDQLKREVEAQVNPDFDAEIRLLHMKRIAEAAGLTLEDIGWTDDVYETHLKKHQSAEGLGPLKKVLGA